MSLALIRLLRPFVVSPQSQAVSQLSIAATARPLKRFTNSIPTALRPQLALLGDRVKCHWPALRAGQSLAWARSAAINSSGQKEQRSAAQGVAQILSGKLRQASIGGLFRPRSTSRVGHWVVEQQAGHGSALRGFSWSGPRARSLSPPSLRAGGRKAAMGLGASLGLYLGIDMGIQVVGWAVSYWQQTDKLYDLTGSLTYLSLAALSLARSSATPHQIIITAMVATWAARLGTFLFARVLHAGKDDRLDRVKSQPGTFLLYWSIQGVWVFVVSLPMLLLNASPPAPLRPLALLGVAVWALGFGVEAVADHQKDRFRRDPRNRGQWIDSGLWRYSRHPNYFGEVVLWSGAAMCAAAALPTLPAAACFLSPLLSYHLTCNVSGLPMVEANAAKRWGSDPAYQAYMRETSAVVPWFRRSNGE